MKKEINYAILTTIDFSLSRFFLPVAYALKNRGINVYLVSNMSKSFFDSNSQLFNCYSISMKRGFHLKQTLFKVSELKKFFKKNRINVVEYATENIGLPASIAAKQIGIPLRIYDHWGNLFVGFSGVKRILVKKIEKIISKHSTHIRQVSQKNMELAIKNKIYDNTKVCVLGKGGTIGVDLSVFDVNKKNIFNKNTRSELGISDDAFVLGFVGRIQKDKGINELVSSFLELKQKHKNIVLVLVGFIDETNPLLNDIAEEIKNNKFIKVTGRVADPEKYMCCFDLLVHPTYREGFGMVLQEASALKIPIITTDIVGPSEFIDNYKTGLLVEPKNKTQLSNSIEFAINNYDNMIEMSEKSYLKTIKYFSRKVMVEQIIKDRISLIESTIRNKR